MPEATGVLEVRGEYQKITAYQQGKLNVEKRNVSVGTNTNERSVDETETNNSAAEWQALPSGQCITIDKQLRQKRTEWQGLNDRQDKEVPSENSLD